MNVKESAYNSILKIKSVLVNQNFLPSDVNEKDYNYELNVKINNNNLKILVYFGKKGVKKIIQGDINSKEYRLLQDLIQDQSSLQFTSTEMSEPEEYIGSDECGKGDFFGPLVVAAVFVNAETQHKLRQMGVRDSKDLSETQIKELAQYIKSIGSENFEIVKINPAKYNELYDKFKNLNKLLNWAHSKAIDTLLQRTNCKTVITDKFSNKDLQVTANTNHSSVEFIQEHRAEKYTGVAAASILARDEFNRWFVYQKKLGHNLPKGSSDAVVEAATKLYKKLNGKQLNEFVKLHFKTINRILKS